MLCSARRCETAERTVLFGDDKNTEIFTGFSLPALGRRHTCELHDLCGGNVGAPTNLPADIFDVINCTLADRSQVL